MELLERDVVFAVVEIELPDDNLRHVPQQALGQPDHVLIVGISLVKLEHGEFRIVLRADAFVAEVAVDLVDALQAAHDQPLQVQFGCDPQIQVHVERVVVGDKGTCHGAARQRLHHRSLNFDIPF